jgi:hypothetical protein
MIAQHRLVSDHIYKVFDEPSVYIFKASFEGQDVMARLENYLKPGDWCFESLMWFFNWEIAKVRFRRWRYLHSIGVNYVVMANSSEEVWRCRVLGIPALLIPQGQFINEQVFKLVDRNRDCQYNAFYAAQAVAFKRLHLAEYVKQLYVLTYACPKNSLGEYNLSQFEPKIEHADWNKHYIFEIQEIINLMHQSHCILALSKVEGAMWASLEGLMCGIPVVSTRSQGGRARYFTAENSRIVPSNSKAIARAVEYYKSHTPEPEKVRASALKRIFFDRKNTAKYFASKVLKNQEWSVSQVESYLFYSKNGIGRFLLE